jgi:NitT/TauT family transport system substrate-binding protein
VDIIYVSDFVNLVSNGLITNEATIEKEPELVGGMVRAALRGLAYALDHPDEAFQIALKHVPEVAGDVQAEAVNRAILDKCIEFWQADAGELGLSNEADWRVSLQTMVEMGLVDGATELDSMFSNEFVEEAQP